MWPWNQKKNIGKVCFCTIANKSFIPGTCVMLHTFFKYNSWFDGDVIIIDHDLSEKEKDILSVFPKIKYVKPDQEVVKAVDPISKCRSDMQYAQLQFSILTLFDLGGYDKYIYVDGDAFFQGSIYKPVKSAKSIAFSPDRPSHLGLARDSVTYKISQDHDGSEKYWYNTFNSGVFIADNTFFNREVYNDLLALIQPEFYMPLRRPTTDQFLFNQYFRKNYDPLSAKYNYRLGLAPILERKKGITLDDAAIIHFSGKKNPWIPDHVLSAVQKEPLYLKAFEKWMHEYESYLTTISGTE